MKIHKRRCYRVAIPLTGRFRKVLAGSAGEALEAVLIDSGMRESRSFTETKDGPNWTFFEIDPPLPRTWLGSGQVPKTVTNPKDHISVVEVEERGEMLLVMETDDG